MCAVVAINASSAFNARITRTTTIAISASGAINTVPTTRIGFVHLLPVWVSLGKFRANTVDRFVFACVELLFVFKYFSFHF